MNYYVWTFNGNWSRDLIKNKIDNYYQDLESKGLKGGNWFFARYNVEWCLFQFRKNEVWIEVL